MGLSRPVVTRPLTPPHHAVPTAHPARPLARTRRPPQRSDMSPSRRVVTPLQARSPKRVALLNGVIWVHQVELLHPPGYSFARGQPCHGSATDRAPGVPHPHGVQRHLVRTTGVGGDLALLVDGHDRPATGVVGTTPETLALGVTSLGPSLHQGDAALGAGGCDCFRCRRPGRTRCRPGGHRGLFRD